MEASGPHSSGCRAAAVGGWACGSPCTSTLRPVSTVCGGLGVWVPHSGARRALVCPQLLLGRPVLKALGTGRSHLMLRPPAKGLRTSFSASLSLFPQLLGLHLHFPVNSAESVPSAFLRTKDSSLNGATVILASGPLGNSLCPCLSPVSPLPLGTG